MARFADPVLIPPRSISEACLRIQEAMPGAVAKGHIEVTVPSRDLVALMYGGERPEPLLDWKFGSVDVTKFYDRVQKHSDGTLKGPSSAWGASDPDLHALFDDYTHEDDPDDEVVFTVPDSGNPHFGRTGKRSVPELEPADFSKLDPEVVAEIRSQASDKVQAALDLAEQKFAAPRPRSRYEPMKSGVWIDTGVNEDDVRAMHPDAELDKAYEAVKSEPDELTKSDHERLTVAVETLVELLQKG